MLNVIIDLSEIHCCLIYFSGPFVKSTENGINSASAVICGTPGKSCNSEASQNVLASHLRPYRSSGSGYLLRTRKSVPEHSAHAQKSKSEKYLFRVRRSEEGYGEKIEADSQVRSRKGGYLFRTRKSIPLEEEEEVAKRGNYLFRTRKASDDFDDDDEVQEVDSNPADFNKRASYLFRTRKSDSDSDELEDDLVKRGNYLFRTRKSEGNKRGTYLFRTRKSDTESEEDDSNEMNKRGTYLFRTRKSDVGKRGNYLFRTRKSDGFSQEQDKRGNYLFRTRKFDPLSNPLEEKRKEYLFRTRKEDPWANKRGEYLFRTRKSLNDDKRGEYLFRTRKMIWDALNSNKRQGGYLFRT